MSISTVFVIKNAFKMGYCFWESLLSCLSFTDELIISEGYSEDETYKYIKKFVNKYKIPKIILYRDKWSEKSYVGEVIKEVSETAIKKATSDWIYLLQADEIISEDLGTYIKKISCSNYNSISFPFYHFIKSWSPCLNPAYKEAVRMIRNKRGITLKGDAWSFVAIEPLFICDKKIHHFAWVFPKSDDIKAIEQSKIYINVTNYQDQMREACKNLKAEKKPYPVDPDFNDYPELARRFIGKMEYSLPEEIV